MWKSVVRVSPLTALSMIFLSVLAVCVPHKVPIGMFRTECRHRHFCLAVNSRFLGVTFRFDVEGVNGVHPASGRRAAECGYTVLLDSWGNLVLRASYLACDVDSQDHTGLQLLVWFINIDADGKEDSYPFLLTCPPQHWSPREIICEENYMEVSVRKPPPSHKHDGLEWMTPSPLGLGQEGATEWRVVFRVPMESSSSAMREETVSLREAQLMGYHVNATGTRIILRSVYSSPHSYFLQEKGVTVEAVSATVFYRHQWTLLMVDTSLACGMHKGEMDGSYVLWRVPQVLTPLVQVPFVDQGVRVGVDGTLLTECEIQQRGYRVGVRDGLVEVRIPFGADGGFIKSHMMHGQYSQSYSVDLFYFQQWKDGHWDLTQHRSFRPLWTPSIPWTPAVINLTVPAEGVFSFTLGPFPPDISLPNLMVADQVIATSEAEKIGFHVSHVPFPNGSHAYLLRVPFYHPLVPQKYLGHRYRRYTLQVNFTLFLSPEEETFSHPVTMVCELQDVVIPKVEAQCTENSVKMKLHYGNMDAQWWLYIGSHRLDQELVDRAGYRLEALGSYLSVEVPLFGLGMAYENLHLQGLVASVVVSVTDVETGALEHSFIQRCTFPVRELMVCLPDGHMVVVVDTAGVVPPVDPKDTRLLDPSCKPRETDSSRALFSFRLDSCGTAVTMEEDDLVFMNEVRYSPKTMANQFIHPSFLYRQPIGCRFPMNGTQPLSIYKSRGAVKVLPLRGKRHWHAPARGNVSCPPWCELWR